MKLRFLVLLTAVFFAYGQESSIPNSASVQCTIKTTDLVWKLGKTIPKISVEARPLGNSSVMPALYLTAVSKKVATPAQEYWAPFDFKNGASTATWQDLGTAPRISANLNPVELMWAPTKSSVWPSQSLAEVLRAGRYNLRVRIEINGGKTFSSNAIEITVIK